MSEASSTVLHSGFHAAEGLRRQIVTFKIEAKLTHAQ